MPSLRVLCVVVLMGLGATAAGLAGSDQRTQGATPSTQRGALPADPGTRSQTGLGARAENGQPGTRDWRITAAAGSAPGLAAYAGSVSVRPGDPVSLHINGQGSVQVRALRIGWYGGAGARQVWRGSVQAAPGPVADPGSWPVAGVVGTTGWPPGHYLLRLDSGAASRYVPLTVRSPSAGGRVLLVTSPLTWQADNPPSSPGGVDHSFDRPYAQGFGAATFLATEAPIIQLAERDGDQFAYATDLDLVSDPALLNGAAAVTFGSASQYWPSALRTSVIAAIRAGTNAAFFGAGTGTRQVELAAGGRGLTVAPASPAPTPALTGLVPVCAPASSSLLPPARPWIVRDPQWWGFRGTTVTAGQRLAGLISQDPDGAPALAQAPGQSMSLLDSSPARCAASSAPAPAADGTSGTSGTSGAGVVRPRPHAAAYWVATGGAAVFTTGTSRWACVAGGSCPGQEGNRVPAASRAFAAAVTRTVLTAFALPAAGAGNPA